MLSLKFQVARYMQLVGMEFERNGVFLVPFSSMFPMKVAGGHALYSNLRKTPTPGP